jgi:hypothetical protein
MKAWPGRDAQCRDEDMRGMRKRLFLAVAFSCAAFWSVSAQERANPQQPTSEAAPVVGQEDLADIMGATQWRHLKLSFAGSVKNWGLADYEVAQIGKSFRRAAQFYPVFENIPVARLIGEISEPALAEVEKSIKDRDGAAFLKSFDKLTAACNSCHQAAKLGFIKMQVPTASPSAIRFSRRLKSEDQSPRPPNSTADSPWRTSGISTSAICSSPGSPYYCCSNGELRRNRSKLRPIVSSSICCGRTRSQASKWATGR